MSRDRKGSMELFWLTYKKKPGSLIMRILVIASAVITVGILFSLIVYILANGIMNLKPVCMGIQHGQYVNDACYSQHSVHNGTVACNGGAYRDIFGDISC